MRRLILFFPVLGMLISNAGLLKAAEMSQQEKLVKSLSYIYAPILGTGYYKAGAESVFVLKLATDNLLRDSSPDARHRILLPVTLGVRKTEFDAILDEGLPDNLHSIGVMPGIAWDYQPHPDWIVVPSVQLGLARDFNIETTAAIYSANLRGVGRWKLKNSNLSWGARIRAAGQRNFDLNQDQGFVLLETGIDWEFAPRVSIGDQMAGFSIYTLFQKYLPDLGIKGISGERIDVENLVHIGMSVELQKSKRFLGIPLKRAGFAFIRGDGLEAITLNLGFPLYRD